MVAPGEPESIAWRRDAAEVRLSGGRTLSTRLVVGADGLRSWARTQAGIAREPHSYGQTAVVANFATEHAHRGFAFQWFLAGRGVLAWLPLPGRRISIVWSAPDALAQELLELDAQALSARVADAGIRMVGELRLITPAAAFPLSFLKLPSVVAHRLALAGDAAHGVHPRGAGRQSGLRRRRRACQRPGCEGPVADVGAPILLERYARRRALPVLAMQAVTDGLVRMFDLPALRMLRNGGMRAVGSVGPLRRLLAQPALR